MLENMREILKNLETMRDLVEETGDIYRQMALDDLIAKQKRLISILVTAGA